MIYFDLVLYFCLVQYFKFVILDWQGLFGRLGLAGFLFVCLFDCWEGMAFSIYPLKLKKKNVRRNNKHVVC